MIPTQTMPDFPVFGSNATKLEPDAAKRAAGFYESEVLPYEWFNYFLNRASTGVTAHNAGLKSVEEEINSVLAAVGATPDATKSYQLRDAILAMNSSTGYDSKIVASNLLDTPIKDTRYLINAANVLLELGAALTQNVKISIFGLYDFTLKYTGIDGTLVTANYKANTNYELLFVGNGKYSNNSVYPVLS